MIRILLVAFLFCLAAQPVTCAAQEKDAESRVWKTANGKFSVSAVFLGVEGGKVRLRREDNGRIAKVPIDVLSDADREYLNKLAKDAMERELEAKEAEAKRIEAEKAEAEKAQRMADEKAEAERAQRIANEKAEAERAQRIANEKAEAERAQRIANEKAEAERAQRIANEKAEAERAQRIANEKAEAERAQRIANEKAEAERAQRMANEKAEAEAQRIEAQRALEAAANTNPETGTEPMSSNGNDLPTPVTKDSTTTKPIKPIVPFRSTKKAKDKSAKMPGNEGIVSSGTGQPKAPAKTISQSPPVPKAPIDVEPVRAVDLGSLRVEKLATDERLKTISDQQLIDSLHLRSEMRWKGNVKLDHLLTPKQPNFEVLLFAENSTALEAATNIGHVDIVEMSDGNGTEFNAAVYPPGVVNARKDWVKIAGERENRFVATQELDKAAVVGIEFVRPQMMPRKLTQLSGEFQLRFAVETQQFTLLNADTEHGEIQHPLLAERGIQLLVSRPDQMTLVVKIVGQVADVRAVKRLANGESTTGAIRTTSGDSGFVQFNFRKEVPASTQLIFEVLTETRTLKVPFDLEDVQLILPESKSDATAG